MAIDPQTVKSVARLARLALSDDEQARFAEQLGRILEYAARLDALPLDGVPPTSHVIPVTNVVRDDVPSASLSRDEVLSEAPAQHAGFFQVPRVFEAE